MARNQKRKIAKSVVLVSVFLYVIVFLLPGCSRLGGKKEDDDFVQGSTVSLDELDYSEGINEPIPEEEEPSPTPGSPGTTGSVAKATPDSSSLSTPPTDIRQIRKRVLVVPFRNRTEYRDQPYGEITTQKLTKALEGSDQVLVLDDQLLDRFLTEREVGQPDLSRPAWIKELYRAFGIHAVISGTLAQLNVGATKSTVSQDIEVGLAIARIEARLVDGATGTTIRTYTGRNPLYKSKEIGEFNQERAILRAIDIAVDEIATALLHSLRFLDWSTRVIRTDPRRIYIDAGRQSGLRNGDILEVYGPGEEIINPVTQVSLGVAPGILKGRVKVSGFYGVDGAYATPIQGDGFIADDVVKIGSSPD
jgi:hypothetical protein